MTSRGFTASLIAVLALLMSEAASAYVGPGAGLSLVGALWGLLLAVGTALLFILLWPIRHALRRRRAAMSAGQERDAADETAKERGRPSEG